METLESALEILLAHASAPRQTETVPLLRALNRIAGEDIASPMAVPPFDRSPLDGYALHSEDIASASRERPVFLRVVGEACAGCGEAFHPGRGEALRLMTGAPVPPECDCVIRQEDTDEGMERVAVYAPVGHGRNICRAGEDVRPGETVLRRGERLTSAHLGVLASLGIAQIKVFRSVRAALLSTGDELTFPGEPLSFGRIYDSNRVTLAARMLELGVDLHMLDAEADDPERISRVLCSAAEDADILITTGGVSVGKKDVMHRVLPLMGAQRLFWRVAMKPGSPLLCGLYQGKLLIALSGNPFAALACFEVFVRPVIGRLSGSAGPSERRLRVRLAGDFPKPSRSRRLVRARFDGERVCAGGGNHSSGSLSGMIGCNCFIDIPAGSGPLADGDEVEILLL